MARTHAPDSLRAVEVRTRYLDTQPGSVLYSSGRTRVLCVATLEPGVPNWLKARQVEGKGQGWATAEYSLLPGSTRPRAERERARVSGRTQEIQRLIGRSLRGVLDLEALDGFTLQVDCDVLQADGGTRTAAINGAYLATELVVREALRAGLLRRSPVRQALGAISVGRVGGQALVDLDYEEDSSADVDLNVVATADGRFLEVQGTAEGAPYSREELDELLDLASKAIREILTVGGRTLAVAG